MTAIDRVINTAQGEEGYLEKASNSQLNSKTANAGTKNYTKYADYLDTLGIYDGKKNGYPWCDVFVDWCFITTFGLETGMSLLCQPMGGYGAGCTESAKYYKKSNQFYTSNPQAGDQIFFSNDGGATMAHTGLVVKVDSSKIYTIEGNTSSAAGVVANGGCVRSKSYLKTYTKIAGFGRPKYSIIKSTQVNEEENIMRYNKISEIPTYAQPTIRKMINKQIMSGSGTGVKDETGLPADLNLSMDMIRVFVTNDRAGLYD